MKNIFAVFKHPGAGYNSDQKRMANFFRERAIFDPTASLSNFVGWEFLVQKAIIGSSHTDIFVFGCSTPFNSVMFDFYENVDGELVQLDITKLSPKEYPVDNPWYRGLLTVKECISDVENALSGAKTWKANLIAGYENKQCSKEYYDMNLIVADVRIRELSDLLELWDGRSL